MFAHPWLSSTQESTRHSKPGHTGNPTVAADTTSTPPYTPSSSGWHHQPFMGKIPKDNLVKAFRAEISSHLIKAILVINE